MIAPGAPRLAVVGSLNMDLSVRVPRLPQPGETLTALELQRSAGGKGANQAVAAHRLGAAVTLVGMVGDDAFGEELIDRLTDEGLDVGAVTRSATAPTGVAMIAVDPAGENTIIVVRGANGELRPAELIGLDQVLAGVDALLLQLEVPTATALVAARAARARGVPVVLNAAPLPASVDDDLAALLAAADLLVVNETEAAGLTGLRDLDSHATTAALRALGPSEVVMTLGERGALAADGAAVHHVAAFRVPAMDAVGAGDVFCAELAIARTSPGRSESLAVATARACAAGALATTRPGAQSAAPRRAEVDQLIAEQQPESSYAS